MSSHDDVIIITKRARGHGHGHHGGSWKIALADFALAMMAFFLVLWLIEVSSQDQKEAIAEYFSRPNFFDDAGAPSPVSFDNSSLGAGTFQPPNEVEEEFSRTPPEENKKKESASAANSLSPHLVVAKSRSIMTNSANTLHIESVPEGIRIDLIDSEKQPMFTKGGNSLSHYFEDLLLAMAPTLAELQIPIKITGHTDGVQFHKAASGNNWNLAFQRAQQARETLVYGGVEESSIDRLVAMADRSLLTPDTPNNIINRRVELLVLLDPSEYSTAKSKKRIAEKLSEATETAHEKAAANQI